MARRSGSLKNALSEYEVEAQNEFSDTDEAKNRQEILASVLGLTPVGAAAGIAAKTASLLPKLYPAYRPGVAAKGYDLVSSNIKSDMIKQAMGTAAITGVSQAYDALNAPATDAANYAGNYGSFGGEAGFNEYGATPQLLDSSPDSVPSGNSEETERLSRAELQRRRDEIDEKDYKNRSNDKARLDIRIPEFKYDPYDSSQTTTNNVIASATPNVVRANDSSKTDTKDNTTDKKKRPKFFDAPFENVFGSENVKYEYPDQDREGRRDRRLNNSTVNRKHGGMIAKGQSKSSSSSPKQSKPRGVGAAIRGFGKALKKQR